MRTHDAGAVGSHRLWDAIDNGAIPVFTDARQYLVLPFPDLWLAMSAMLDNSDHMAATDALATVVDKVKKRWSSLQHTLGIGRKIASWSTPGSRALDAYVKLLSMRMSNTMSARHCDGLGHCVRHPCSGNECVWNIISHDSGCEQNKDGDGSFRFRKIEHVSLTQCLATCEKSDCRAIDYGVEPNLPAGTCVLFRRACHKPVKRLKFGSMISYRLKVMKAAPPKIHMTQKEKRFKAVLAAKAARLARIKKIAAAKRAANEAKKWARINKIKMIKKNNAAKRNKMISQKRAFAEARKHNKSPATTTTMQNVLVLGIKEDE